MGKFIIPSGSRLQSARTILFDVIEDVLHHDVPSQVIFHFPRDRADGGWAERIERCDFLQRVIDFGVSQVDCGVSGKPVFCPKACSTAFRISPNAGLSFTVFKAGAPQLAVLLS